MPVELRFHADRRGLVGLLDGSVDLDQVLEQLQGHWFRRQRGGNGGMRGLYHVITVDRLRAAVAEFQSAYAVDPVAASSMLVRRVVEPVLAATGRPSWVETTPRNVLSSTTLNRMFPRMKLVHVIRDGRDVARSAQRVGAFADLARGIDWWARVLRRAHHEYVQLPAGRVHILRLEDLVLNDRERTYLGLLDFLGLDDAPVARAYFDTEVSGERAHPGQWARDLDAPEARRIREHYAKALAGLAADGVAGAPSPDVV